MKSNSVKEIKGVMYSTFKNDYSKLEEWANYVWGGCSLVENINWTSFSSY